MEPLNGALTDVAIEARVAIGAAPVRGQSVGECIEEPTGRGESSFDSDRSECDRHEASSGLYNAASSAFPSLVHGVKSRADVWECRSLWLRPPQRASARAGGHRRRRSANVR